MKTKIFILVTIFILVVGALSFTVLLSNSQVIKKKYKSSKLFSKSATDKSTVTNTNSEIRLNNQDSAVNKLQGNDKLSENPTEKQNRKTIDCKEKGGNMENGFGSECLFKNYNLAEAYNEFRKKNKANDDGKFLEEKMPPNKHIATFREYPTSVTYSYPEANILDIEILFPGGVTVINFREDKDDVKVNVNHSPD